MVKASKGNLPIMKSTREATNLTLIHLSHITDIPVDDILIPGAELLPLNAYLPHITLGMNEGYLTPLHILLIVKPFSIGEETILEWAYQQDPEAVLTSTIPFDAHRDLMILERNHTSTSATQALAAHYNRISQLLQKTAPEVINLD